MARPGDRRVNAIAALAAFLVAVFPCAAKAAPVPFRRMQSEIRRIATHLPAQSAFEILDLSSGLVAGYNSHESMPAASTIKVPVMVEVFKKLEAGAFTLNRRVTLQAGDRDDGSGDLAVEPLGTTYTVSDLLARMVDVSDNTAANMLIRLVGRREINRTMYALGLRHTWLADAIHTEGWTVRDTLRSSPADMVRLFKLMAQRKLVDSWASNQMIALLEADRINSLLPAALPSGVTVAHKTGSFFDTLNDVGIVYAAGAPYVIAVMTTGLPSRDSGATFIHDLSRVVYHFERRFAEWRIAQALGAGVFAIGGTGAPLAPDVLYWDKAVPQKGPGR